ncbi:MAG: ATP-binding cassette domain-containing protein [Chloroflexota bacterium]|nr:ATP-binding cassette domain-containing protein [Chloroflexota bacterium]
MSLLLEQVSKAFTNVQAVDHLSLEVGQGHIFGFLGPNGAGKTTTIRMILDIIRPDAGQITWNGVTVGEVSRRAWGYLPEERGLYPKMAVDEQLIFLARLYGIPKAQAVKDLNEWLERFQITENRKKKVEELSKGNQQKIQFLATILHDPDILIMDEPFTGLDPVNVNLLKSAFLEMHQRGKTIIFSTHQMEQVEELCEEIAIIDKGKIVVGGSLRQVKRSSGRKLLRLALDNDPVIAWLDQMSGVKVTKRRQDYVEMELSTPVLPEEVLQAALHQGGSVTRFEVVEPSLSDIFIERVGGITNGQAIAAPEQADFVQTLG